MKEYLKNQENLADNMTVAEVKQQAIEALRKAKSYALFDFTAEAPKFIAHGMPVEKMLVLIPMMMTAALQVEQDKSDEMIEPDLQPPTLN